jgi:outer membrane biosynthesis protein TonB
MAKTYLTPRKSTGGRVPTGQLAPRHRLEDVEEEPEEIQPEAEIEEAPEEVQPKPVEEEDPEEVEMKEEPKEQPQLYDGTVLEAGADGDVVIPPAPMAADEAPPAPVAPAPNAVGGDPDDSGDDSGDEDEDDNNVNENPVEEEDENPRYRGAEYHKHSTEEENGKFVSFCEKFCSTWGTP